MSVFPPRNCKLIVEAARDLIPGCRTDDGAIDKPRLEAEIREHLFSNLALKDWYDLKDRALDFKIHEYVKWAIHNSKPGRRFKGDGETGRRQVYQVPNKTGRGFTAKPWEDLTADDLEALKTYHEASLKSRLDELVQITGELELRAARAEEREQREEGAAA